MACGVSAPDSPRAPRKSILMGPDGRIAAAYERVKPADHPAQALADLDRLA